jgi:serine/threonine-protein kinase
MGDVYRALDTNLGREVAIKVLPEAFAHDPERLARFEREAKTLASLNHPNIAAIYGLERAGGLTALVMELVEGPTLADRIARSPIPVDEALPIAKQIAEALEAAHEQGIIHRDLKPANIKLRPDGTVKVLDFGLAKALEPSSVAVGATQSPTITSPVMMTGVGMLLGTAAYMSPEQTRGKAIDKRSDIWAFGCVLYEMLTGRRAIEGDDVADIFAGVIKGQVAWELLPTTTPPAIRRLLRRCLVKEVRDRLSAAADVRLELNDAILNEVVGEATAAGASSKRNVLALIGSAGATAFLCAIIGIVIFFRAIPPAPPGAVVRFSLGVPASAFAPTIAPDGAQLVYVADGQLFLRSLSEPQARPLAGTKLGASQPVFSPDGRWVAFYAAQDRTFKKVAVAGGAPVTIAEGGSASPLEISWDGGRIAYSLLQTGILAVSTDGGEPEIIVPVKPPEVAAHPQLLEDGATLLFTHATEGGVGRWDSAEVIIQSLDAPDRRVVFRGGSAARYLTSGHIAYAVGSTLFAVPFDLDNRRVSGGPVLVLENLLRGPNNTGIAYYAASANGSLVSLPTGVGQGNLAIRERLLAIADRDGRVARLPLPPAAYYHPRVSPDGRQLLVGTDDGTEAIVWIYDLARGGVLRRLTFEGRNTSPIWTPDARRVTFNSDREGDLGMFWQPSDGSGPAERLSKPEPGIEHRPESWSPDGRTLAFLVTGGGGGGLGQGDIWTLSIEGDRTPQPLVEVPFNQRFVAFAPDGRWFAYVSTEVGGRMQAFVQPFPPTGAKYQITTDGGRTPLWSSNGREIFYDQDGTDRIFTLELITAPTFTIGKPRMLPIERAMLGGPGRNFDTTPDGKQFVIVLPASDSVGDPARGQLDITLNWFEELKRLVPVN